MEDDRIVDLFLSRDESAIYCTQEKYGSRLRNISKRITEDHATAEECENDTYLEAWNRIPPNEPRTYLFAFLAKIIRNISINRCLKRDSLKRKAYITELSKELEQCIPDKNSIDNHIAGIELEKTISDFLRQQSKEKRVIFMQRYYYLDSISAIAKRFDYSESRVKTKLFRMRKDLRDYLMKEGYTL
ncbi:MAG: sigma-70 family RNA polymerase sigma factor [Firmicutes bacterium]|nr:sigma-70 family RNA polymerase sigma factor [Bacillota bacterium]